MTALPDADRTRLASVRRVLVAVWRWLNAASRVVWTVARGLVVDVGIAAVVVAIYREDGAFLGIAAAGAWLLLYVALIVRHIRARRR